jgi:hypothetical protein
MKAKTVLVAAVAGGVGYVLGTRAGREKFEELKARANDLAHSQQAQDAAAKVAAEVKERTSTLPDPVANVINTAADAVAEAPKPDAVPGSGPGSTSATTA